jgi:hypothetical protein
MLAAEFAISRPLGRFSGDDLVQWLSEHRAVHGWWLCFDANAELMKARPQHCLAFLAGSDVATTETAMRDSGLVNVGVRQKQRIKLLGTSMVTKRVYLPSLNRYFNFLWLGMTMDLPLGVDTPWSVQDQLDGKASRAPPSVAPWNRAATRQAACATPHAAVTPAAADGAASAAAGTAVTPAAADGAASAAAGTSGEDASARLTRRASLRPSRRDEGGAAAAAATPGAAAAAATPAAGASASGGATSSTDDASGRRTLRAFKRPQPHGDEQPHGRKRVRFAPDGDADGADDGAEQAEGEAEGEEEGEEEGEVEGEEEGEAEEEWMADEGGAEADGEAGGEASGEAGGEAGGEASGEEEGGESAGQQLREMLQRIADRPGEDESDDDAWEEVLEEKADLLRKSLKKLDPSGVAEEVHEEDEKSINHIIHQRGVATSRKVEVLAELCAFCARLCEPDREYVQSRSESQRSDESQPDELLPGESQRSNEAQLEQEMLDDEHREGTPQWSRSETRSGHVR